MTETAEAAVKPEWNAGDVAMAILAKATEVVRRRVGGYGGPMPSVTVGKDDGRYQPFHVEWLGHTTGLRVDKTEYLGIAKTGAIYGPPLGEALVDAVKALPPDAEPGKVFVLRMVPA
jgi:hypothetical protein